VILLRAKDVDFEVTYIDLSDKPDWFLKISPHGKVPVLSVDDEPLFESNAIAEYLDDVVAPPKHPGDAFKRARNRAWTDFVPDFSKGINIYYTKTKEAMEEKLAAAPVFLQKLEDAIARERGNEGPYFNGPELCLVDAAYAPFLQRLLMVEQFTQTNMLREFPLVQAWAEALVANDSVKGSVADSFNDMFYTNLKNRDFYVGTLLSEDVVAAE
jgi:glutathione S-transferase